MPRGSSEPSIKDRKMYDALRDDGASKEKAARISNAANRDGRDTVGSRGGRAEAYEEWTVKDLRARAKELGLTGYSDMTKDRLISALRDH